MRCEHDTHTAELPGLPALPVKPPRTTQAQRIENMGYLPAKQRRGCANCKHFDAYYLNPDSLAEREMTRCSRGDFPVQRGGCCNDWLPA